MEKSAPLNNLWPVSASLREDDSLSIDGLAVAELAQSYGTPLYIIDEATLRDRCRVYRRTLGAVYGASAQAAYASKAYLCTALAQIVMEEELDLDVVSGGELFVTLRAGFPSERIHFHGNNKSPEELGEALATRIGRIVVDNFTELALLDELAAGCGTRAKIWLRLAPGVQAHTHSHIQTGQEDTKFGFSIHSGDAEKAVIQALGARALQLTGLHAHIGSQIYEPESLADAAARLVAFAAEMRARHGFELCELSPGGGWGVPMTGADAPAPIEPYLGALCAAVATGCEQHGLPLPHLVIEPGRSLVAQAGVAVYTVGARKEIPGVRTYVALDGGMADNIRPALYGAQYIPRPVSGGAGRPLETVTLAGKYCESGDILISDIHLPHLDCGDLLAIPMAGAYTLSMASNYNLARRPAVILVGGGQTRLIQRRETYEDLVARDVGSDANQTMSFHKYHAHGNDYIVLDPVNWPECPDEDTLRRLCDRHHGVGADGVLWGPVGRDPFPLRLFNPDGSEFEKSGNGLRIFARYLWDQRLPCGRDFDISTPGGTVTAHVLDAQGNRIAMDMGRASFDSREIGIASTRSEITEESVEAGGRTVRLSAVSMGNPHCVVFAVDGREMKSMDELISLAHSVGPHLEGLSLYRNRTNVQFARVVDRHTLEIAIWERGAGYTLASGTSSCAAAAVAARTDRCASPVTVRMPGGEMLVEIDADWRVRLTGAVTPVMAGVWVR